MAQEHSIGSGNWSPSNTTGDLSEWRSRQRDAYLVWALWAAVIVLSLADLALQLEQPDTRATVYDVVNAILGALETVIYAGVGALILARRERNTVGALLMFIGVGLSILNAAGAYLEQIVGIPPAPNLASYLYLWLNGWGWWVGMGPLFLILLTFPTGRLLSPRWRWIIYALAAQFVFFLVFQALLSTWTDANSPRSLPGPFPLIPDSFLAAFLVPWAAALVIEAALCVSSVFIRYRRAGAVEREQLKWFLYACGVFLAAYALAFFDHSSFRGDVWGAVFNAALLLIPLSIGIAILRYRLWDIDVIIRRTVVYVPLTAILAGLFAVSIDLSKRLFLAIAGGQSEAATVLTTLIVVAAFDPIKMGLQNLVDRRFKESPDPNQRLRAFQDQVQNEMGVIDPVRMMNRLLKESLEAFGAASGEVSFRNSDGRVISRTMGDWKRRGEIRVPLISEGAEVGAIALGPRANGLHYSEQDRAALLRTAAIVADALRGEPGGASPSTEPPAILSPAE